MKNLSVTSLCIASFTFFACIPKPKQGNSVHPEANKVVSEKPQLSEGARLVAETIEAHGGTRYDSAAYRFKFRDKTYTFSNDAKNYIYTSKSIKDKDTIIDILENGKFSHTVNGKLVELSEKDIDIKTEAVNSVVYFATLPFKLSDKAVKKTYGGQTTIKGQKYELLHIDFNEEGGGKDHSDTFLYWINFNTKTVDYLAYSYSTNGGGVRFRSAFNPKTISGIRFQDYVNYKVPIGTSLKDIPMMYEAGKLKELSRILTEDVESLKK